jgi:hypothetical protein
VHAGFNGCSCYLVLQPVCVPHQLRVVRLSQRQCNMLPSRGIPGCPTRALALLSCACSLTVWLFSISSRHVLFGTVC